MIQPATLLAAFGVSLQLQIGILQPDRSIFGTVTATEPAGSVGSPISSAAIELTDAGGGTRRLQSDSTGAYVLTRLDAGLYTLHVAREGYRELTLQVRVPDQGAVHLDVALERLPPVLTMVKILARPGPPATNN